MILKTVSIVGGRVKATGKIVNTEDQSIKFDIPVRRWEREEVEVEIWEDEEATTFACATGVVVKKGLLLGGQLLPYSLQH